MLDLLLRLFRAELRSWPGGGQVVAGDFMKLFAPFDSVHSVTERRLKNSNLYGIAQKGPIAAGWQ